MEKTRHPGIYKRGSRYVVRFRANGKNHAESCRTLDEALQIKRARESARDRGELDLVKQARTSLREFAGEWVERYQGNGKRGFTEHTRDEYRRDLSRYVFPRLGDRRIGSISPRDVSEWVAWLCDDTAQGKRRDGEQQQEATAKGKPLPAGKPLRLSDATVRRITSPLRACLATARREGVIRSNPCDGVPLPTRPKIERAGEPAQRAKALTRDQLGMFLRVVPKKWRLLFRLLAATGLRWSELAALSWGDLRLDGSELSLRVRRAYVKGTFKPPKSRHGVRSIPLDSELARELRAYKRSAEFNAADDLVFCSRTGSPLRQENVRRRVMAVAAGEAGVPWIGFHTFRHTCASLLFASGRNVKQVQQWLGHHSPGFTLDTYVHLMDDGVGGALDLGQELAGKGENEVRTDPLEQDGTQRDSAQVESVV
jgi:integrase